MTNYLLNAIKRRNQQLHQYDQEEYDTVHVWSTDNTIYHMQQKSKRQKQVKLDRLLMNAMPKSEVPLAFFTIEAP